VGYCTLADLKDLGILEDAIRTISTERQQKAIEAASAEMDGYLGSQYRLPLKNWGLDVKMMCARLATYILIAARGFDPDDDGDRQIQAMHDMAERWLQRVANGNMAIQVEDSSGQGQGLLTGGALVVSNGSRGYQDQNGGAFTSRRR